MKRWMLQIICIRSVSGKSGIAITHTHTHKKGGEGEEGGRGFGKGWMMGGEGKEMLLTMSEVVGMRYDGQAGS